MADTAFGTSAADPSDPSNPVYDAARRRIQQQGQINTQQNQETAARAAAANGTLTSGDYAKTQQLVADQSQNSTATNIQGVDVAQQQEQVQRSNIKQQQGFQTSERQAAQGYQTSERQAAQGFQSGYLDKQQLFNKDLFNQDLEFKKSVQASNVDFQSFQKVMAEKEFQNSQRANYINSIIGLANADVDPTKLGRIQSSLNGLPVTFDQQGNPQWPQFTGFGG